MQIRLEAQRNGAVLWRSALCWKGETRQLLNLNLTRGKCQPYPVCGLMKLLADSFLLLILLEYRIIIPKLSQWCCSQKVASGKEALSRWGGPQSCHLLLT